MTDSASRKEFVQKFSDLFPTDNDELTELLMDLDNINGLTSRCDGYDLYYSFVLEGIAHPLLTFSIKDNHASAFIEPIKLTSFLKEHGVFPFEAEDFFNEFKSFLISYPSSTSYPYGEKYFADINEAVENESGFVSAFLRFMNAIYLR